MTWQVQFQPAARLEVFEAAEWYDAQARGLGQNFLQELQFGLTRLRENPAQYQLLTGELRRVRLRKFPFILLYNIEDHAVTIVRCVHARRDPRGWQGS